MKRVQALPRGLFAALFILAGANHFWHTTFYVNIMPPYLPWHRELVQISGVAEIVLGAMLLVPRWSIPAAWGLMALLVAIFPANVHMAVHAELYPSVPPLLLWLRLPLQGVLVAWAHRYTRSEAADAIAHAEGK